LKMVAISVGSNLGNRLFYIEAMERALRSILVGDVRTSPIMETEPVGVGIDQPAYLNMIVTGYYQGDAYELLNSCLSIENTLGRTRPKPKAPRTADVDILLFGDAVINDPPRLIIPHPELRNRRFCLEGLVLIDPSIQIPESGSALTVTAGELYDGMAPEVAAQKVSFLLLNK